MARDDPRRKQALTLVITGTALLSFGVVSLIEFLIYTPLCGLPCGFPWPNLGVSIAFLGVGGAFFALGTILSPEVFLGPDGMVETSVLSLFLGSAVMDVGIAIAATTGHMTGWVGYLYPGDRSPLFLPVLFGAGGYLLVEGSRRWWNVPARTR